MLQINANKFICDREAKALGLKGPVDFIEGEDGCDKRIEEYMKNKAHITESSGDKKAFDVCIMNPPYDKNLHLKILEKVIPYAEETINISPIRWLQDPLAKYKKNSDYNKFKESVAEHIKSVKVVNPEKHFDIFFDDLAIIHCDENGGYEVKVDELADKIINNIKVSMKDLVEHKKTDYFVPTLKFHYTETKSGDRMGIPFGLKLGTTGKYAKSGWTEHLHDTYELIYFDTQEEADNFRKFLDLDAYKVILGKIFYGKRLSMQFIPMGDDYTHPWDSRRFCDYFNITGYISDTEAEPGSEWEEILKTMEKYK